MSQIKLVRCGSTDYATEEPATSNLTPAHVSLIHTGDIPSNGTDYLANCTPHCISTISTYGTAEDLDCRLIMDAMELMQASERAGGNEEEGLRDTIPQQEIPQQKAPPTSKQRDSHRRTKERREREKRERREREGRAEGMVSGKVEGEKLEGQEQRSSGSRQPKKKSNKLGQKAGELTEVNSVGQKRKAIEDPRTSKRAKVNPPSLPVTPTPSHIVLTNSQRRRYRHQRGMQLQAAKASGSGY